MPGQRQGRWFLGTGGGPSQSQEGPAQHSGMLCHVPAARYQARGRGAGVEPERQFQSPQAPGEV